MYRALRSHDCMASQLIAPFLFMNEDKNLELSSPVPAILKAGDMIA